MSSPPATPRGAIRVVICDYNTTLQSITGLLRMSGYAVYQAYDAEAAMELCQFFPTVDLLVINTDGTGMDTPSLVDTVRRFHPRLPVLHIGKSPIPGMPSDVMHLAESFNAEQLLETVRALVPGQLVPQR